jgi:uncharacterized protein YndB with AHSA1/START domain
MTSHIHQEITFDAPPARVFAAYMNSAEHAAFTGRPADIGRASGEPFTCHAGQISGRNVDIEEGTLIVQAWRVGGWDAGFYSLVTLALKPEGDGTRLVLDHAGVPDEAKEHIASGWHQMYWEPLRNHLAAKA